MTGTGWSNTTSMQKHKKMEKERIKEFKNINIKKIQKKELSERYLTFDENEFIIIDDLGTRNHQAVLATNNKIIIHYKIQRKTYCSTSY